MGRIKSKLVKRTAKTLLKNHEFSSDFDENKKILKDTMPGKKVRNQVAGYLVRLKKRPETAAEV